MSDPAPIRSFVALEVPLAVKEALAAELGVLRSDLPRASWVRPEAMHLTLKFLGEQPRDLLGGLVERLRSRLSERSPIGVRLAGAGVFPNPVRPRVAWVGGTAGGAAECAADVDRASASLGLPRERRAWALHLTVARLRSPWPRPAVERFLDWGASFSLPPFTCAEAVLFASRLTPQGAVYTPLDRIPLGGPQL